MLARNAFKQVVRASNLTTGVKVGARKAINTSTKASDAVPAVSYRDGQRIESEIEVLTCQEGPIKPAVLDTKREAVRLNSSIIPQLTPTLSKFTLTDKVAVVTGAGRGLGYNMAQALAESGVSGIAILDTQYDIAKTAALDISKETGVHCWAYHLDVTNADDAKDAIKSVYDRFGTVNIVINAAGIADSNMKAETYDITKFRRLIDINLTGTFIVTQAVAQHMIGNKTPGSIINIASMSGSVVNYPQEQCCYNASKAAVIQLTKSLAAEWAPHNIRVNSISPGYMDTALNRAPALEAQKKIWVDLTPQKRLGSVDDLNALAVYLAGDGSGYMTGSNCIIDGGYTLW